MKKILLLITLSTIICSCGQNARESEQNAKEKELLDRERALLEKEKEVLSKSNFTEKPNGYKSTNENRENKR